MWKVIEPKGTCISHGVILVNIKSDSLFTIAKARIMPIIGVKLSDDGFPTECNRSMSFLMYLVSALILVSGFFLSTPQWSCSTIGAVQALTCSMGCNMLQTAIACMLSVLVT